MPDEEQPADQQPPAERDSGETIGELLELPMFVLAMVMLVLLIVEFSFDLAPGARGTVLLTQQVIWWIFIAEYAFRVFTADNRIRYLKEHWIDGLFIAVPFLRVLRVARALRALRILRTLRPTVALKMFVTTRRGLRQLGNVLGRRSFLYVTATTVVVTLVSALMMFLMERGAPGSNIRSYGSALWWAIGIVTTVGNELYAVTAEGRVLSTILMIYGMGIFGYVAATLASYFINVDASEAEEERESSSVPTGLNREVRARLEELNTKLDGLLEQSRNSPNE